MPNTTCALTRQTRPSGHGVVRSSSVAGVVLRSARRSARASRARIATACGVTEHTIQAWETGSLPLASVPMPQIEVLIAALHAVRACRRLTADLIPAAWCDLIIAGVAATEDVTCLLADPITAHNAFGELLSWYLDGRVPQRHYPYARVSPLVTEPIVIERVRRTLGRA